jgi:hypothetical protein
MKKMVFGILPVLSFGFFLAKKNSDPGSKSQYYADEQYDGPYVQYKGDQIFLQYITQNNGAKKVVRDSMPLSQKGSVSFRVATDEPGKMFSVSLKTELKAEKAEYKNVSKQLVISDIEGNFSAFRKLLQANGAIDENFNWIFGTGHLVLVGDFTDRGEQVTEVHWLIYSLEEKAKAAGGYIHYILGNHELMNLTGDNRYLNPKYSETVILLNEKYESLYSENSELGRWLRTKNIVEKIDKVLYTHAGISGEINKMDITLGELNQLSRPFYADTTYNFPDKRIDTIFSDWGPFWYRGYYKNVTEAIPSQIDDTFSKFRVKKIVTGHTVIADTISVLYKGKLINTDVHHAKGHSEAMLIEGDKFYRVNALGEKFLLLEK